jgi:hypothetical protein
MKQIIKIVSFIVIVTMCVGCPLSMETRTYSLFLNNTSHHNISVLIGDLISEINYPDTTLMHNIHKNNIIKITCTGQTRTGACGILSSELKWTDWAKSLPLDTFSLFLFDTDTLARYSLDEIKAEYKILQRYDLSSGDIEKLLDEYERVIIPYPPDEKMKNMKMYPPYGK